MFRAKKENEGEITQYTDESVGRTKAEFDFEHFVKSAVVPTRLTKGWRDRFLSAIIILFGFGTDLVTVLASRIKAGKIVWLWPERIPLGKLTLFVGYPDNGKSMVATDVAATVTTGRVWPDERNGLRACDVLFFADEDDPADTTVPRLMASGANLDRISFGEMPCANSGQLQIERQMQLDTDIEAIEKHLDNNPNIKLIVLDPVSNYLGNAKMIDEQAVRRVLSPLQKLAAKKFVAILGIMHLNKKQGLQVINRIGGAMAFVGVARAVWLFNADKDQQGSFHMLPVKKNIGKRVGGLKYRIATREVEIDGEAVQQPYVEWGGKSHLSAYELLEARPQGRPREEREEAAQWLTRSLADGPKPSTEVEAECEAAGISYRTLERVKDEPNSPFESFRADDRWSWRLRD
jgi:putative DNA primase/helicase